MSGWSGCDEQTKAKVDAQLDQAERDYVVEALCRWIEADIAGSGR